MSFTIQTENDEWTISRGTVPVFGRIVWVAFNKAMDHIQADTLDHLYIAIGQFEDNPKEEGQ